MFLTDQETVIFEDLRGDSFEVDASTIEKINETTREGIDVVHFVGGGWKFVRAFTIDLEFTDEGEDNEQNEVCDN